MTSRHSQAHGWHRLALGLLNCTRATPLQRSTDNALRTTTSMDFHLIANFAALALITLAGPAVIFILFYRRGAL